MPVIVQRLAHREIERGLRRGQRAVVDVPRGVAEVIPEREVDRVEGAVGHAIGAPGGTGVPIPAGLGLAAHTHHEGLVARHAVLHRVEAVAVREQVLHQVVLRLRRIRAVAIERHRLGHQPAVVAVAIQVHLGCEVVTPVEEGVVVVGVGDADLVLPAQLGEAGAIVQARAIGRVLLADLRGNSHPAMLAQGEAEVALQPGAGAVAGRVLAVVALHLAAGRALLQDDVDDAGQRVRTVLRRGTVAQHLDVVDRADRDRVDVDALRALAHLAERQHQRARVPALAVDEDQHLIAVEAAHLERPHEGERVGHRGQREIQRWHGEIERVAQAHRAGIVQHLAGDHVHRHQRAGLRAIAGARAGHDHLRQVDGVLLLLLLLLAGRRRTRRRGVRALRRRRLLRGAGAGQHQRDR
ncbi:hypothetical protein RLIN73S_03059 [Rhodanobacter lindaniclasticus]